MGSKTITVTWDERTNQPTAPDLTVNQSDGQTTIAWEAGAGVSDLSIQGLDSNEFIDMNGSGTDRVTVLDKNDNTRNTEYAYTIEATHTTGKTTTAKSDPKIINGGRPSLGVGKPKTRSGPQPSLD